MAVGVRAVERPLKAVKVQSKMLRTQVLLELQAPESQLMPPRILDLKPMSAQLFPRPFQMRWPLQVYATWITSPDGMGTPAPGFRRPSTLATIV